MLARMSFKRLVLAPVMAAALCVLGCASHRSSARADHKAPPPIDSVAYETQVKEEAARLLRDNRGLTAREAFAAARESVAANYGSVGPTRAEREQAEAQDKFEADLSKLSK